MLPKAAKTGAKFCQKIPHEILAKKERKFWDAMHTPKYVGRFFQDSTWITSRTHIQNKLI
jgi:hypothetical protein